MHTGTLFDCTKTCLIRINKPPDDRIIIPGLEVAHGDLRIEVIASVAEGVNGGDVAAGGVGSDGAYAPGVVAVGALGGYAKYWVKMSGFAFKLVQRVNWAAKLAPIVEKLILLAITGMKFLINGIVKSFSRKPGESWPKTINRILGWS